MRPVRAIAWTGLAAVILAAFALAAMSPLLAWRQVIYILAGFAGVVALGLLLLQPALMVGLLTASPLQARRLHRGVGAGIVASVFVHVGGLWLTSPPDVIDALTLQSPTPFSAWGVAALWALLAIAGLAVLRRRGALRPRLWRQAHLSLALVVVAGTAVHALLIDGTMETVSKAVLCGLLAVATLAVVAGLRVRS